MGIIRSIGNNCGPVQFGLSKRRVSEEADIAMMGRFRTLCTQYLADHPTNTNRKTGNKWSKGPLKAAVLAAHPNFEFSDGKCGWFATKLLLSVAADTINGDRKLEKKYSQKLTIAGQRVLQSTLDVIQDKLALVSRINAGRQEARKLGCPQVPPDFDLFNAPRLIEHLVAKRLAAAKK